MQKLFVSAPYLSTFSGTWSGKTPAVTHGQTGQMGAGTSYGRPQAVQSAADSK